MADLSSDGRVRDGLSIGGTIVLLAEGATGDELVVIAGRDVKCENPGSVSLTRLVPPRDGVLSVLGNGLFSRATP